MLNLGGFLIDFLLSAFKDGSSEGARNARYNLAVLLRGEMHLKVGFRLISPRHTCHVVVTFPYIYVNIISFDEILVGDN